VTIKGRISSLDAIRGVASLMVLFSHCYQTIPEHRRTNLESFRWWRPLGILHNGHAAVIIFFVLSGYVLSLPHFRGTQASYSRYLVKRFCRIYLPFAIAIMIAAGLYLTVGRQQSPEASQWFNALWPASWPGFSALAGHFLMIGTEPDMQLDCVMWTLVYEMRISILFPLLMMLCRNTKVALFTSLAMLVLSTKLLAALHLNSHPSGVQNFGTTLLWTIKFVPSFVAGILLSKHRQHIAAALQRVPAQMRVAALSLPIFGIFFVSHSFDYAKKDAFYDLGAALVIVFALEIPTVTVFLEGKVAQWLGRISYSLYLIHVPVLLVLFPLLLGRMPLSLAALIAIAASLSAATVLYILIEAPAIELGHRLAAPRS
jgi:peptidoglycan/LPS O-acetylase OafA/YrhL